MVEVYFKRFWFLIMGIERKRMTLKVTQRELKVLTGLEKWGILGLGQIYGLAVETDVDIENRVERFFNETRRRDYGRWFTKRLSGLYGLGLLQEHFFLNYRKVFTLTEAGHKKLQSLGLSSVMTLRSAVSEDYLNHELMVSAVGLVLQEIHGLAIRTERERDKSYRLGGRGPAAEKAVSDLWVAAARPKAIEVELTQKSESRYKEIWDAYRLRLPEGATVLYLTAWPSGVPCILKHAREQRAEFIFACGLREFRNACGRSTFTAFNGRTMVLAEHGERPAGLQLAGLPQTQLRPYQLASSSFPPGEKGESL